MSSPAHEPREEFVAQLENRLRTDFRRQRLESNARWWTWLPQSRLAAGLALVAIMLASMALGGGVVAASYESRLSSQRDMLLNSFDQRQAIAQQRLALVKQQLREMEGRVQVGLEQKEFLLDMQAKVTEAEAEVKTIDLDIAEIKATGREPMHSLSAPLVAGRDIVTERWRVEMGVPLAALTFEKTRAAGARRNLEVGVGKGADVEDAMTRIAELEAVVQAFERKLAIRQTFLKGGLPGPTADLRGLEADNESRHTALTRRIEATRSRAQALQSRIEIGTANPLELAEVRLRLQELELERSKIDYELLLIRKQLGK
jgi:hypothetical protein